MTNPSRAILGKASAVTALAIAATYGVFLIERAITGIPFTHVDLIECFAIPIAVGMPILCYLFSQSERLKEANQRITAINEEMQESYRQLRLAHEIMVYTANHDRMTGLPNRERFIEHLEAAHRGQQRDVLLLIDADHFKQINDRLGHLRGDDALVEIARAVRQSVRGGDVVGRIGGEEFAVLLKDVSPAHAADIAEKIRQRVESIPWPVPVSGAPGLSVSIGGAPLGEELATVPEILELADRRLYAAKRAGRNRVVFTDPMEKVA
ncbi:GGDEF domain-containing protein [Chelativorans sp.]|uniref:GGDEF domain-containing protein n=1 Tax=Chelativorans sp. TaxID=2203393 RepID=UPI00281206E3|nr:GGDEF domain-containing protein [Chelativorans sp.]